MAALRWGVHHTGTSKVYAPRASLNLYEKVTQHLLWGRKRHGKHISDCKIYLLKVQLQQDSWKIYFSSLKDLWKIVQCVWPWAPRRKFNMQSPALTHLLKVGALGCESSPAICKSASEIRLKLDFKNFPSSAGQRPKARYKVRSHGEKL